MVSEISQNQ
jgi:hypothetical protein